MSKLADFSNTEIRIAIDGAHDLDSRGYPVSEASVTAYEGALTEAIGAVAKIACLWNVRAFRAPQGSVEARSQTDHELHGYSLENALLEGAKDAVVMVGGVWKFSAVYLPTVNPRA